MGSAGIADTAEPGAIWLNPAGLAQQHGPATSFLHGAWVEGVALEQFAVSGPTPAGWLGGAVLMLRSGDITGYDATGSETGVFAPSDTYTSVAWATAMDRYTFGASASYLRSELADDAKASAMSVDAGAGARLLPLLTVAAAVQHLGGKLNYGSAAARLPATVRAGGAYEIPAYRITLVLDGIKPQDGVVGVHFGAEERFIVRESLSLAVRAGWHSDGPRGGATGAAAGAGLDWHPAGGFGDDPRSADQEHTPYLVKSVRVEYAWTPVGELGAANWFSLALNF